jgi:hypothetical protein
MGNDVLIISLALMAVLIISLVLMAVVIISPALMIDIRKDKPVGP